MNDNSNINELEREVGILDDSLGEYDLLKQNIEIGIQATEYEIDRYEHYIDVLSTAKSDMAFWLKLRKSQALKKSQLLLVITILVSVGMMTFLGVPITILLMLAMISVILGVHILEAYEMYFRDTEEIRFVVDNYTEELLDKQLGKKFRKLDELKLKLSNVNGMIKDLESERTDIQRKLVEIQSMMSEVEKEVLEDGVENVPPMRLRERKE